MEDIRQPPTKFGTDCPVPLIGWKLDDPFHATILDALGYCHRDDTLAVNIGLESDQETEGDHVWPTSTNGVQCNGKKCPPGAVYAGVPAL